MCNSCSAYISMLGLCPLFSFFFFVCPLSLSPTHAKFFAGSVLWTLVARLRLYSFFGYACILFPCPCWNSMHILERRQLTLSQPESICGVRVFAEKHTPLSSLSLSSSPFFSPSFPKQKGKKAEGPTTLYVKVRWFHVGETAPEPLLLELPPTCSYLKAKHNIDAFVAKSSFQTPSYTTTLPAGSCIFGKWTMKSLPPSRNKGEDLTLI